MTLLSQIPPAAVTVTVFNAGTFNKAVEKAPHIKTCPHLILAQAVAGRYGICCGDGRSAELRQGEAFLAPADLPLTITHHGLAKEGERMHARWFDLQILLFGGIRFFSLYDLPLRITREQCRPFEPLIEQMLLLQNRNAESLSGIIGRHALALQAAEALCAIGRMRPDALELLQHKDRLVPLLAFMEAHLAEKLTVETLAHAAHMSVPHFHAFFRRFFGHPPMKHLKQMRLAKACRLLTGDRTLAAIAGETGFCNEYHLSREFSRRFGKPPGAWRRSFDRTLT